MSLVLKKIILSNFLSHEETEIDLTGKEQILIDGQSGSGKSSVVDAVVWCLYNKARTDNKGVVRMGQKHASVTLHLQDGEKLYKVSRQMKSGKHTLQVSELIGADWVAIEVTGTRGQQDFIEREILGASYELFVNSVVSLQDSPDSFVTQTAPRRKELLLEIVRADNYDELLERTKELMSKELVASSLASSQLEMIGSRQLELSRKATEAEDLELQLPAAVERLKIIRAELDVLTERRIAADSTRKYVEGLALRVESVQNSINQNRSTLGTVSGVRSRRDEYVAELAKISLTATADIEVQISSLQKDLKDLQLPKEQVRELYRDHTKPTVTEVEKIQAQIAALDTTFTEQCPSGPLCPHERHVHSRRAELQAQIPDAFAKDTAAASMYEARAAQITSMNELIAQNSTREFAIAGDIATLRAKIESVTSDTRRHVELLSLIEDERSLEERRSQQLGSLEEQHSAYLTELATITAEYEKSKALLPTDITELDTAIATTSKDKQSLESWVASAEVKIADGRQAGVDMQELARQHDHLVTEKERAISAAAKLGLLKTALGPNGLKAMIIDYMVPYLEDKINEILSTLSEFKIRIDTQRDSSDGDSKVEGLFLTIINDLGHELAFDSYSGGERNKITVAISEALSSLQKVGFRFFDETVTALDENALSSFMMTLTKMLGRYNQVFMISHIAEIKDMFEHRMLVTKVGGTSRVERL